LPSIGEEGALPSNPKQLIRRLKMKRLSILLPLSLLVVSSALARQDGGSNDSKKPKAEKPTVDCTTVGDAAISSGVKERLAKAPSLKDANINVEAKEGVVTLKGTVKSGGLKGVATRMARRVDCVKRVDNQLSVEQSSKSNDEAKKSGR
jgi:hypothetical protein